MNSKNLIYKYIYNQKNQDLIKFSLAVFSSFLVLIVFFISNKVQDSEETQTTENSVNLNVMIPEGYVLFSFEAENYDQVSPLLEPYSMVKVYSPETGKMLAQNIKVLRAPKDPSQLSFLVPVNIANYFAYFGLEYRIVIQKYESNKKPQIIEYSKKKAGVTVTFGGLKNESN